MARNVLIVDDEPYVLRALEGMLRRSGWAPTGVGDAQAALQLLSEQKFDAVVADLVLGRGLTGLEILEQLPRLNRGSRFIVLTGYATPGQCRTAFLLGAADFLQKPIGRHRLLAALEPRPWTTPVGGDDVSTEDASTARARVRRVTQEIERRFADPALTVRGLAENEGVSVEHLCRLFASEAGTSVGHRLRDARLTEAGRLLRSTFLSIAVVATSCGYRSSSQFDRHFRRRHRCTPTEYRLRADRVAHSKD